MFAQPFGRSMSSARSAKAISGSIIQNSARWRAVLLFSARKVGPKVYPAQRGGAELGLQLSAHGQVGDPPEEILRGSVPLVSSRVVTRTSHTPPHRWR